MRYTKLDQITVCADGSIGIRLLKQVVDGGEVLFSEPHRTTVDPLGDVVAQMAEVNAHLSSMGYPPLSDKDVAHIEVLKTTHITYGAG